MLLSSQFDLPRGSHQCQSPPSPNESRADWIDGIERWRKWRRCWWQWRRRRSSPHHERWDILQPLGAWPPYMELDKVASYIVHLRLHFWKSKKLNLMHQVTAWGRVSAEMRQNSMLELQGPGLPVWGLRPPAPPHQSAWDAGKLVPLCGGPEHHCTLWGLYQGLEQSIGRLQQEYKQVGAKKTLSSLKMIKR